MSCDVKPGTLPAGSAPELEPVYFGSASELFGCLHAAKSLQRSNRAVLICPPIAAEHVRCYRPLRLLAAMLAGAGLPVLRFDYFGTGDSLGELEDASLDRWLDDIAQAVRYLRGRTRAMQVVLLGVRIGASRATRFHVERESMREVVLWDPVVDGRRFIEQLRQQSAEHARWMVETHGERPASVPPDGPLDLHGFRFSQALLDELSALSLADLPDEVRGRLMLLDDEDEAATGAFAELLQGRGAKVSHQRVDAATVWMSEPHQGIVPSQSLKQLVDWLTEGDA